MKVYSSEIKETAPYNSYYAVWYRRMGEKKQRLFLSEDDALHFRFITLRKNRRKFLGMKKFS